MTRAHSIGRHIGLVFLITWAPAARCYDALYTFGDSLTDTGREPAEPVLHYDGRWSNGPLWVEYLSAALGFPYDPNHNLAHSGAQTDDTLGQVTQFVPVSSLKHALCVVWAGGNDFLQDYDKYWFDDAGWDGQIAYSVGSLSNAVVSLYSKGARFILVPNTVDVTDIPLLNWLPEAVRSYFRDKVRQFNRELFMSLDSIQAAYPALELFRIDFFSRVKEFIGNAEDLGFTRTRVDALSDATLLDKRFDGPGARYVFWDPIHPTSKSHGIVATWFQGVVAPLSASRIRMGLLRSGNLFELALDSLDPGAGYVIQGSRDLSIWSDLVNVSSFSSRFLATVTNDFPEFYFRLQPQQ